MTRQLIAEENKEDIYLRTKVLQNFQTRAEANPEKPGGLTATKLAEFALSAVELTFWQRGLELAAFLNQAGDPQDLCIADQVDKVLTDAVIDKAIYGAAKDTVLAILRGAFYESTSEERSLFDKLSRAYSLLFLLNSEPRIVEYFRGMSADFVLFVGSDILIQALSERYLRPEDQMVCNTLAILKRAGAQLVLAQPVAEEIASHFRATNSEFENYFKRNEQYMTREIARHCDKILLRTYFYGKLSPLPGTKPPEGWRSFVNQFLPYEEIATLRGEALLRDYLVERFEMDFLAHEDLEALCDADELEDLTERLVPYKKDAKEILARNDARMILGVYGKRRELRENARGNPYGYRTWWLTHEARVQAATSELVGKHGARYLIRPEFVLNFVALSPKLEDVRRSYANVFPSIIGLKLSNRLRRDAFHDVIRRYEEVSGYDDARRRTLAGQLSNNLKGDFVKNYSRTMRELEMQKQRG